MTDRSMWTVCVFYLSNTCHITFLSGAIVDQISLVSERTEGYGEVSAKRTFFPAASTRFGSAGKGIQSTARFGAGNDTPIKGLQSKVRPDNGSIFPSSCRCLLDPKKNDTVVSGSRTIVSAFATMPRLSTYSSTSRFCFTSSQPEAG